MLDKDYSQKQKSVQAIELSNAEMEKLSGGGYEKKAGFYYEKKYYEKKAGYYYSITK